MTIKFIEFTTLMWSLYKKIGSFLVPPMSLMMIHFSSRKRHCCANFCFLDLLLLSSLTQLKMSHSRSFPCSVMSFGKFFSFLVVMNLSESSKTFWNWMLIYQFFWEFSVTFNEMRASLRRFASSFLSVCLKHE